VGGTKTSEIEKRRHYFHNRAAIKKKYTDEADKKGIN